MSGPKTGRYKLTPAQRRQLIEQRERQRRADEAAAFAVHYTARLNNMGEPPAEQLEQAKSLREHTGGDGGYIDLYEEYLKKRREALELLKNTDKKDPDLLEKAVEQAKKTVEELAEIKGRLSGIAAENSSKLRAYLADKIGELAAVDFGSIKASAEQSLSQRKEQLSQRLSRLYERELSPELLLEIKAAQNKLSEIGSEDFLNNFGSVTIADLEKRCNAYSELYKNCGEEYSRLCGVYSALCGQLEKEPQSVPFDQNAVSRLAQLVSQAETELLELREQEYISRCIDEAMTEMGYNLVGSREVAKKNGRKFHNELYTFSEGTAVNVTYSSNGNITMEIGAADDTDRLPTAEEAYRLTEDMHSFCGRFKELHRRLAEKGVEAENISMLPPDKQYAQIINISEYNMTGEISKQDDTIIAENKREHLHHE